MLRGERARGDLTLGDFDLAFSRSIADALDGLLENPQQARSWLFRALPRDKSTSTNPPTLIPVNLSTDGHSHGIDDLEPIHFPESIMSPYSLSFSLKKKLWGIVQTTFGQVIVGDPRSELRNLVAEDWVERVCDIYVGPRGGSQPQFAKVATLLSRGISSGRNTITVIVDDHGFLFERLLQDNFYLGLGDGTLEGGDDIAGSPKPRLFGVKRHFEPITVDASRLIYQINDGSFDSVIAVDDSGLPITFNADVADIEALTPPANTYNSSLATGYMRLGSTPVGALTVDATGHNSSAYGYADDIAGLSKVLVVDFAGLADPSELDIPAFDELATYTSSIGEFVTKPMKIRDLLERFNRSAGAWGWLRPDKIYTVGRITDPSLATPDFTLDGDNEDQVRIEPLRNLPYELPVGRVLVGYRQYPKRLRESDLDPSVPVTDRNDWNLEYRFAKAEGDASYFKQNPGYQEITILTNLDDKDEAQDFADEQFGLRRCGKRLLTVSPRTGLIKRGVGNVFSLVTESIAGGVHNYVILGVVNVAEVDGRADRIEFECFGGPDG